MNNEWQRDARTMQEKNTDEFVCHIVPIPVSTKYWLKNDVFVGEGAERGGCIFGSWEPEQLM